jgi:hypothetical protein
VEAHFNLENVTVKNITSLSKKKKKNGSADEVIICLPIWAAINQLEVYCQSPPLACLVSYCLSFVGGFLYLPNCKPSEQKRLLTALNTHKTHTLS